LWLIYVMMDKEAGKSLEGGEEPQKERRKCTQR
jgi:hypothetical protein